MILFCARRNSTFYDPAVQSPSNSVLALYRLVGAISLPLPPLSLPLSLLLLFDLVKWDSIFSRLPREELSRLPAVLFLYVDIAR